MCALTNAEKSTIALRTLVRTHQENIKSLWPWAKSKGQSLVR